MGRTRRHRGLAPPRPSPPPPPHPSLRDTFPIQGKDSLPSDPSPSWGGWPGGPGGAEARRRVVGVFPSNGAAAAPSVAPRHLPHEGKGLAPVDSLPLMGRVARRAGWGGRAAGEWLASSHPSPPPPPHPSLRDTFPIQGKDSAPPRSKPPFTPGVAEGLLALLSSAYDSTCVCGRRWASLNHKNRGRTADVPRQKTESAGHLPQQRS